MEHWTRAIELLDVAVGDAVTLKLDDKQIALFRTSETDAFALDNRCPHEGYPLAQGAVKDGVLTCEWHNWKFSLCDGACVLGGESVRSYPLEIRDGGVYLDLRDPPRHLETPRHYRSLGESFDESDWPQAGRAVERLLVAEEPASRILAYGCVWSARRAPYGYDHGLAAAADIAEMIRLGVSEPGHLLLEGLNLLVEPNVRRPLRARAPARAIGESLATPLRDALEAENLAQAEGLVRAAVATDRAPEALAALAVAAGDHFLDYGHAEIYAIKAEELLDAIGWEHADSILCSLAASIGLATREDRLPYMKQYRQLCAPHMARCGEWSQGSSDADFDVDALCGAVLDEGLDAALGGVAAALDAGAAPARVALVLALSAAHRMLRFDANLELDDEVGEGWLHVTHALTYADAVREHVSRRPSADAIRSLFSSARFVNHMRPLDADGWADAAFVQARDAEVLRHIAISDSASIPIFVVHHIKTAMAAIRLDAAVRGDRALAKRDDAAAMMQAASRFVDSPLVERRVGRQAATASLFVRTGRRSRKLLGY